ncbi:hypothetical protein MKW94_016408, partial [Papaver nudicaule]|nr:hypothetical protein [Papaver nudicaule]
MKGHSGPYAQHSYQSNKKYIVGQGPIKEATDIKKQGGIVSNLQMAYRCTCKQGFEGNPYLPPGCK